MGISKSVFKFQKHELIGTEGAEEDQDYLFDCFVDTGDLEVLRDTHHPARIVEGRTGSGKTALLMTLKHQEENVSFIDPEDLSLQFLSNSNIINYLEKNGVDLDIFYRLLWRHILAVELIKMKYDIKNETDQKGFISRMYEKYIGDSQKKEAYEYLTEWGEKFWKNTEERIKEVTKKFENDISAKITGSIPNFSSSLSGGKKFSDEEKVEIVSRAQDVVNTVQIQKLSKIIKTLAEDEFINKQQRYYIVIDKLDEKWVDDSIRYKLIRALIEAIKDLKKIQTSKIIIAIRKDLIDRVFMYTRDAGFQEEKYQPLFLRINWTEKNLLDVMEKRLNVLIKRQYTKGWIKWNEVIVNKIGKLDTEKYLISRTMYRPRDIISFINNCISNSVGLASISASKIRDAETNYSDVRFKALGDEWISDYPNLLLFLSILKGRPISFKFSEITKTDIDNLAIEILSSDVKESCYIEDLCHKYYEGYIKYLDLLSSMAQIFYKIGVIGIRLKNREISWSFKGENMVLPD
ncbi:MAG: hypothetical protein ABIJ50_13485 [Pseudomonadota bacterium]